MNIFYLDKNIKKCAHYHFDTHVIKMILESTQILCSALWLNNLKAPYKPTHIKHPCVVWVSQSLSNWLWLKELIEELNSEYRFRFNKNINHKSYEKASLLKAPKIPDLGITSRPQAMPEKYQCQDSILAYRNYYVGEKSHLARWSNRDKPEWFC